MANTTDSFLDELRRHIYRHFLRQGRAPLVAEIAQHFSCPVRQVRTSLQRLSQNHAFVLQENGELWRAAPFSAVPTAFPVQVGRKSWYGNCVWDALGIPAMLQQDALIPASCGCCNYEMTLNISGGKLREKRGIIHFAVPARQWYEDIVFT